MSNNPFFFFICWLKLISHYKISLSLIEFLVGVIIFNQVNQARCDQRLPNKNKNIIFLNCYGNILFRIYISNFV
jgi:hypothetical protein